ncbi:transcriptional regulator, TetR family [Clostridium sp. DL-VIII]|uniref:TetR/AcrR family transcriptional regulator n=1 Tax=Clostridium sp. DL-VIII TaxID=641107 RepID=UPI00023AFDED|nr:TetR/AcrR family transcriptional regulator [Clostridium sp. DL-VIII]EHI99000.1 transcriptional regulator, TetR family [Clostridium sp. DL-VIII]
MSEKRKEIIEASAALMRSKGYENTALSDILEAGQIGKGQFYHYFSSKHELGLAVIDYFFESFNEELFKNILGSEKSAEVRFNEMLEWVIVRHQARETKCGCIFGNFAAEMSEHDEEFRQKVQKVFEIWIEKLKLVLEEMVKSVKPIESFEVQKLAQGIVAMLEGGILIMKNRQDIKVLEDMTDLAKDMVNNFIKVHC